MAALQPTLRLKPSPKADPKDIECNFERYHAIYSALSSSIYKTVAKYYGVDFRLAGRPKKVPVLFCPEGAETHYKYADAARVVHDPYERYQLPNTHGNCLFYALYSALRDHRVGIAFPKLYDSSANGLIAEVVSVDDPTVTFLKVVPDKKQLAYKCFVHNDLEIFKWVFDTLKIHEGFGFRDEWDTMSDEEKIGFGIPENYTFDDYISEFRSIMNIDESYKMTYDQVVNWDRQAKNGLHDYENSGIEGGVVEEDYVIKPGDPLRGGRRKTRKTRKTRKRV
jgi:hypothetical protein